MIIRVKCHKKHSGIGDLGLVVVNNSMLICSLLRLSKPRFNLYLLSVFLAFWALVFSIFNVGNYSAYMKLMLVFVMSYFCTPNHYTQ